MKKRIAFFLLVCAVACLLGGCGEKTPQSVFYNGKEYKTGFYGSYEFQNDRASIAGEEISIDGTAYQVLNLEEHDWLCTNEETPTVYCSAETWEQEAAFYEDEENYFYAISFGNALNPVDMIHITGMDDAAYTDLRRFADKHSFNPKHPKADKGQLECPKPEAEASEIHFYRTSSDNLFSEGKLRTYFYINNQAVMLYSEGEDPDTCLVVLMPDELTDLIGDLVNTLSAIPQ